MAEEFYSLVTDYGAEKQLRCITDGIPFEVTHIALGDGNGKYYEPSRTQTKLVNEVWRGNVEKCEWTDNRFYCVIFIFHVQQISSEVIKLEHHFRLLCRNVLLNFYKKSVPNFIIFDVNFYQKKY